MRKWIIISVYLLGCIFMILTGMKIQAQKIHLHNRGYDVEYNAMTAIADRVEYYLSPSDFQGHRKAKRKAFKVDRRTPAPRAKTSHYTNSGYQRGHLCPAADRSQDKTLYEETFLLSNVAPMSPALNLGAWKSTEDHTRHLSQVYRRVRVVVLVWHTESIAHRLPDSPIVIPYAFGKQVFTADTDSLLQEWFIYN